jgi:hypothetical protein
MIRFLLNALTFAILVLRFLVWSRDEAEGQLDKMQQKVHFTPGAESPLPPPVLLGGAGLVVGHFVLGRTLWRLTGGQLLATLLLGLAGGLAWYLLQMERANSQ